MVLHKTISISLSYRLRTFSDIPAISFYKRFLIFITLLLGEVDEDVEGDCEKLQVKFGLYCTCMVKPFAKLEGIQRLGLSVPV